jgi:hypothetical protein
MLEATAAVAAITVAVEAPSTMAVAGAVTSPGAGGEWEGLSAVRAKATQYASLLINKLASVKNSKGGGDDGESCADPCQEFKQGFWGVSSGLPLV